MKRLRDQPLGTKLALSILAVSGTALAVASTAFIAYDRVSSDEALVRRLTGEAEIVGFNAATALLFHDPRSAATTLGALRGDLPVTAAAIYTPGGEPFATYQRTASAPLPPPPQVLGAGHEIRDGELWVRQPIVFEGATLGTLAIRCELSERERRLHRYLGIAAAVFLVALCVALVVGLTMQRRITRPLLELADVARAVEERGDFSQRPPPLERGDELGLLVTAFSRMLERLQQRDEQLRQAQAELESRLLERTELHRRAAEANRLKDEFLATLSHELRKIGRAHV